MNFYEKIRPSILSSFLFAMGGASTYINQTATCPIVVPIMLYTMAAGIFFHNNIHSLPDEALTEAMGQHINNRNGQEFLV